jgi:hypothetical protein
VLTKKGSAMANQVIMPKMSDTMEEGIDGALGAD